MNNIPLQKIISLRFTTRGEHREHKLFIRKNVKEIAYNKDKAANVGVQVSTWGHPACREKKAAEARSRATDVLQHEHDRTLRVLLYLKPAAIIVTARIESVISQP